MLRPGPPFENGCYPGDDDRAEDDCNPADALSSPANAASRRMKRNDHRQDDSTKQTDSGATTGYRSEPWAMADSLCGSMDSTEEAGEAAQDRDEYLPGGLPSGCRRRQAGGA